MSEGPNKSKLFWKAINTLTKSKTNRTSSPIRDISANDLNNYFSNVPNLTVKEDRSETNDLRLLHNFCNSKNIRSESTIPYVTVYEVHFYLTHLKQTRTRGLDGLDGKILKLCASIISDSLTYLYNLCIDKSYFPDMLKQAKIIPLHKSGDKLDTSNYRPISILSNLSKPLEKHIHKHLMSHLTVNNLLHPNQSGFRKQHSCHTALTNLVEEWLMNINNNEYTGVLFVDFAKAFDVIDHKLLLRKLALYKFSDESLSLIKSFISNRQHMVVLGNVQSQYKCQTYGVPQGSVLGPFLFSLYINDLPLYIFEALCELFADDTTIHTSHSNLSQLERSMQNNVNHLVQWTKLNHMSLNEQKTKFSTETPEYLQNAFSIYK